MSDTILDEVREILQKSSTISFGQEYVIGLVAELEATQKERDWLAKALAEDGCPYLALWADFGSNRPDWCICIDTEDDGFDCNGDPKECWKKEAARKRRGGRG